MSFEPGPGAPHLGPHAHIRRLAAGYQRTLLVHRPGRLWNYAGMGHPEDPDTTMAERHRAIPHDPDEAERQQALRRRLVEFVQTAQACDIHPLPLETYRGHRRYQSSVFGWLLVPDTCLAVATDAELYRLHLEGGGSRSKAPVRQEWIRPAYWHGWASRWVTLEEMLVDAVARGTSRLT